jgi:2-amino-4-hydroxy-6-hydroxymethyldihydropteridine diphosphokinase
MTRQVTAGFFSTKRSHVRETGVSIMHVRAGIALGSNLGDRLENLREARKQVSQLPRVRKPILHSHIFETTPVGCEEGAPSFYNAVIELGFAGTADQLLHQLQGIERRLGRRCDHARNVSRTIDLDLLYFGEEQRVSDALHLPHGRMKGREFVLRPLAEIAPQLRLPGEKASVVELLAKLPADPSMRCIQVIW